MSMEKNGQILSRYRRNSGHTQGDRTAKWRTVDGKLLLDLGKKAVYSSYTLRRFSGRSAAGSRSTATA